MTSFVLAPDSFKESMTAIEACAAMQRGILSVLPSASCIYAPMADGGEGTLEALLSSHNGVKVSCAVMGPLADQIVTADLGLIDQHKTAVIEMAQANGIHLLSISQRNPMLTSTHGTGEMIKYVLDLGVEKIIMGLGGSVTNDGGAGMAQALGVRFLDTQQREIRICGGNLDQIQTIDVSGLDSRLAQTEILIASDVNNPLCGEQGASAIFAPQKGATAEMVAILEQHLQHYADQVAKTLEVDHQYQAGAGAAGGLGFGLLSFTGAHIQSGVELVIEHSGLAEKIAQADIVLTGEGKIDQQTVYGKTPFGGRTVGKALWQASICICRDCR